MLENHLLCGFSQCSHICSAFSPTLNDDLQTQVVLPDTISHTTMKRGEQDEFAMTPHACSCLLCSNSPLWCRELSGCPPLACIPPPPPLISEGSTTLDKRPFLYLYLLMPTPASWISAQGCPPDSRKRRGDSGSILVTYGKNSFSIYILN